MTYGPIFQKFVEPARIRPALWRLIVGVPSMLVVYAAVVALVAVAIVTFTGFNDFEWLLTPEAFAEPVPLLILLSTFLGMALAPIVVARLLHKRGPGSLMGRGAIVLKDFSVAAALYLVVGVPASIAWMAFGDVEANLNFSAWIYFLPFALTGILVQTLAEELVFRGYFQQQLAARFSSPVAWLILPSLLFGFAHYDPSSGGGSALAIVAVTTIFGLIAADLTARTGSLGAAWGFHFANNFMAMCLISVDGSLTGLSLYKTGFSLAEDGLPPIVIAGDIGLIVLVWWITRRLLSR